MCIINFYLLIYSLSSLLSSLLITLYAYRIEEYTRVAETTHWQPSHGSS